MEFYSAEPSATTAWRLAVLLGANARTYKFALASALLEHAGLGRSEVTLRELAESYSKEIVQHAVVAPQAPANNALAPRDFLSLVNIESEETLAMGAPTERLIQAAVRSMPVMVMQKFHNLPGRDEAPHRFYDLRKDGGEGTVEFTPSLIALASSKELHSLRSELSARWQIVETAFQAGVGRALVGEGLGVDLGLGMLVEKRRRKSVTGITAAIIGFQYGRCLICSEPITEADQTAVDHVFPFSLMSRTNLLTNPSLDLDCVWNLAPAHAICNSQKSNRPPTREEVQRLAQRNEAIMLSPHPLRRTLEISLAQQGVKWKPSSWHRFLAKVL